MAEMYFGTRERMNWIKAPAPGAGMTAVGYNSSINFLNGGAKVRNSIGAHMEYSFTWGSLKRDQVADIEDYAFGLYGDSLIYWLNPYDMDRNLFNRQWSAPKITAEDGIPLVGTQRPAKVLVGDMSMDYPLYGAQYKITSGDAGLTFHCPIPNGYTAWVGAHGVASSQGLRVQPTAGGVATGSPTSVAITGVTTTTRFTQSFPASATGRGIDIKVDTSATATLTFAGLMLQVIRTGETPVAGGFISGRGHSGCVFGGKPVTSTYQVNSMVESIGLSASLIETGDWL